MLRGCHYEENGRVEDDVTRMLPESYEETAPVEFWLNYVAD